jgi:hypothetical protein
MNYDAGWGEGDSLSSAARRILLQRIADTLNIPVDELRGAPPSTPLSDENAQLFHHWSRITDPMKRRLILDLTEKLALDAEN